MSPDDKTKRDLAKSLQGIALDHGLILETCSEELELSSMGINHGKCIDDKLIAELCRGEVKVKKDKNQRKALKIRAVTI